MKFFLMVILFFLPISKSVLGGEKNILEDVISYMEKEKPEIEIYYISPYILFRIAPNEQTIKKWFTRHEKVCWRQYQENINDFKKIDLKKIDTKEENFNVRILAFLKAKNNKEIKYTISMGSKIKINNEMYKENQEIWDIFEKIIDTENNASH